MTERLYYNDSYISEFTAQVVAMRENGGGFEVVLDRSAFYPTSGGQGFDAGTIGGANVLGVNASDGEVVHAVDRRLEVGSKVLGTVDWPRRFDNMQQHTADHMIAGEIHRRYGGYTIGLHIGQAFSTIDVVMPDGALHMTDSQVREIEDAVNGDIQRDVPVRCFFPSEDELLKLPLRKDPTVQEHIRVVMIGEHECVACGGTHVSSAGQLGLVKIIWTAPARGKLRLAFISGMRAFSDFRERFIQSERAAALLSCKPGELRDAVAMMQEKLRAAETELAQLKRLRAHEMARVIEDECELLPNGWRLIAHAAEDMDQAALRELVKSVIAKPQTCILISAGKSLIFARSEGEFAHMGKLMSEVAQKHGGKGGGRPDFAQGSSEVPGAVETARKMICENV